MINKRFLSGVLSAALITTSVLSVSAATFPDVENDATVEWAKPYIQEMSDVGYINGYEDGTFRPNNTISKTEALLLLSRMVGVNKSEYSDSAANALSEYESKLSKFTTSYPKEICFLLYTGVLFENELDSYISTANKNMPLKRYEAAVLLTKLLGAESEVKNNSFVSSSYADTVEIPAEARAYVEYVKEKKIMEGMGNTAAGQPIFSPNTNVTRAQMAKMLCCLIDVLDLSTETGTVVGVDTFNDKITATINGLDVVNAVSEATKLKIGGKDATLSDFKANMNIKITHLNGMVTLIEEYTPAEEVKDAVIKGLISQVKETENAQTIVIVDTNDNTKKTTYTLTADAKVRINGAIDSFGKLKAGNYVALTLENGLVSNVEVISKESTAYGVLEALDISGDYTILKLKDKAGNLNSYEVSADGVQVSRNERGSNLGALMIGDSIAVRMVYGKVTRISATSSNQVLSGKLSYLTYTANGATLGIDISGETKEYPVNKSAEILVDSAEGSIYDLRPGTDIKIQLQSSEVVKIEAAGAISKSQLSGIIKSTNATYGLMIVEDGGVEYNVFVNSNTKIIDSLTGNNMTLKSVEKGRSASVTGSTSSGVLEATVIVVQ